MKNNGEFSYRNFPWGPLIALYSAVSFVALGLDMSLLHLGYRHYIFMTIAPIVFCGVAVVVSLVTAFSGWLRRQAWALGLFAILVGAIGTVIHLQIAFSGISRFSIGILVEHLIFDPRPPLAPAAIAGTGVLLVLLACAERWPIDGVINAVKGIPVIRDWVISRKTEDGKE